MGNYLRTYSEILGNAGYNTQIFARFFNKKQFKGLVKHYDDFNENNFDLLNYHHGIGDPVADIAADVKIPVLIYYHNITPAEYFLEYNWETFQLLVMGRNQLKNIAKNADYALCASKYSEHGLVENNYKHHSIMPIFFDAEKLANIKPDEKTVNFLHKRKHSFPVALIHRSGRAVPSVAIRCLSKGRQDAW